MALIEQFFEKWTATIELTSALILLVGVITLLILGVKFIKRTGDIRRSQSKRYVLDEINKWAIDVGTCIHTYSDLLNERKIRKLEEARSYLTDRCSEMQPNFTVLAMRCEYLRELVKAQIFLRKPVYDSIENLNRVLKILQSYIENIEKIEQRKGFEKAIDNIARNEKNLYDCILDLTRRVGSAQSVI